jgi:hypothetical protein
VVLLFRFKLADLATDTNVVIKVVQSVKTLDQIKIKDAVMFPN